MEITAFAIVGAVIAAVMGACANWIARPKWAERHPRKVVAAVAVLAVAGAVISVVADQMSDSKDEVEAAPPGAVAPSTPPTEPSPATGVPETEPSSGREESGSGGTSGPPVGSGNPPPQPPVVTDPPPSTSPLRVVTASLPVVEVGVSWRADLTASGGTAGYRWSVGSGSLPTGFVLQPAGQINGTAQTPVPRTFEVVVTDKMGKSATKKFTIVPRPRRSDITRDGPVDCEDKAVLQSQWNQSGPDLSGDLNKDDVVNITDLSIMMSDWTGSSGEC